MRRHDLENSRIKLFFDKDVGKKVPKILKSLGIDALAHDDIYHPNKSIPDLPRIRSQSKRGRVLIQCDRIRDIRRDSSKIQTYIDAKARVFLIGGNFTAFETLLALLSGWNQICRIIQKESGPFIYMVHDNGRIGKRFPRQSDP